MRFNRMHWMQRAAFAALLFWGVAWAADEPTPDASSDPRSLDTQIQDLKAEVLKLNRELFVLEEELLFPSNTQISVFVSLDVGEYFKLDSVQLKINNKEVANYLYTSRELDALVRGGVHRLYTGNMRTGPHEVVAVFTGIGPNGRDYKRGAELTIKKELSPKFLELKVQDSSKTQQPEFSIKEW